MAGAKPTAWIAGTIVLVLVILGLGWMGVAAPQFAHASAAQEEVATVEQQNATLRARNAELSAQFARLDELKADLADLRTGIPTEPERAELIRQVEAAAAAHAVVITDLLVSPVAVVDTTLPTLESTEPAAADDGEGEPAADSTAAPDPATEPAAAPAADSADAADGTSTAEPAQLLEGFYSLPVSVTVQGTYADVKAFITELQEGIGRLFLVQTLAATSLLESSGDAGLPPRALGDVELNISGAAFVLADPAAASEPVEPPAPLPAPTGVNPFMPVTGDASQEAAADD